MFRSIRRLAASALVATFVALSASPALAGDYYKYYEYDNDPWGVPQDALIMRPAGMAAFVLGIGMFIPAAVMTTLIGQPQNIDKVFNALVLEPAQWEFVEPIGSH